MKFKIKILIILGILMALIGGALVWDYFKSVSSPKSKYYCQTDFDCVLSGSDPEGFGICVNKEWYEEWKKNPESKKYRWECEYTGKEKCGCINNRCQRIDSGIGRGVKENQVINTSNWKTYRNEKYGFEIDYPNDWKTVRYEDDRFVIYKKSLENRRNFAIGVTTEVVDCYYDAEWKAELEPKVFKCFDEAFGLSATYKEIKTTYGVKGFLGEGGGALYGPIKAAVFALPRKKTVRGQVWFIIAVIYYRLDTDYTLKDLEIFNQVVSSFRYITSQWRIKEIETKIYPGAVY